MIFEGEYINGKRNGKGKEYTHYYGLTFEGEYFGGLKWNMKGYDESRNIVYELKNGKGYINLSKNGYLILEGECYYGEFSGIGKKNMFGFICEGEYIKYILDGYGIAHYLDGDYEGEWIQNKKEGYGIKYYLNGDRYEGEFKNNIFNGYGIFYSSLGFVCKGKYIDCLSTRILFLFYKIILFFNSIYLNILRNKNI